MKRNSRWTACGAVLLVLTLVAMAGTASGQQAERSSGSDAARIRRTAPADVAARQRFLEMFARAYFPGRTGQLLIVPREGDFITRPDPDVAYMHGSPWAYDVSIPLMFAGPAVRTGVYSMPAVQQDVAPTLAAALGVSMPPTATGRVLPVLRPGFARPRVVFVLVLDGMRRDYFDRYADVMPTLPRYAGAPRGSARRTSTFAFEHRCWTLDDLDWHRSFHPRRHGQQHLRPHPQAAPRPVRRDDAAGSDGIDACRRLATHHIRPRDRLGAGQRRASGDAARRPWCVSAEWRAGRARQLRRGDGCLAARSRLFPSAGVFEGSQRERTVVGGERVAASQNRFACGGASLGALPRVRSRRDDRHDRARAAGRRRCCGPSSAELQRRGFRGHRYGPDSNELRLTLGEMDRNLARIIGALEAKVGKDYLLAVTADHGMPSAPPERRHLAPALVDLLHQKFDPQEKQLVTAYEPENAQMFVDEDRLSLLGLTLGDVARFLEAQPFVFSVFTHDDVRRAAEAASHVTPTRRQTKFE